MNFTLYHGLRNSAGGILSASQSLLDDLPEAHVDHRVLMRAIQQSCRSMLQLLEDKFELAGGRTDTDLISLIRQQLAQNAALAERKDIELALVAHRDVPVIQVGTPEINLIVDELIGNGVNFARPGSRVEVQVSVNDRHVMMSVQNVGVRPPAEGAKPAAKAETVDGAAFELVPRTVQGHNGNLQVDNDSGEGPRLTIHLPLTRKKEPCAERGVLRPSVPSQR